MEKNIGISRIGNDNVISIKDLPQEQMEQIDPQHLKSLTEEKVFGGIFNDKSIKLYRTSNNIESSFPDSTDLTFRIRNNKGNNNSGGGDDGMGDLERRVESLEFTTRKVQDQLDNIKEDTLTTRTKLENIVTKADILQLQATLTQTLQDTVKTLPNDNAVKVIINDAIKSNEIPDQTKVKNMIHDSHKSLIKWIIGTGLATITATVAIIRLFLQ